jgi:hypothetical protein
MMLRQPDWLLHGSNAAEAHGVHKGRKLGVLGYAMKRNSGQLLLRADLGGIGGRASTTCSVADRRYRERECRCRSRYGFQ